MRKSVYLVAPRSTIPSYWGFSPDRYGLTPMVPVADLALSTVAALLAKHFDVTVCNEALTPVDFDAPADVVGITGDVSHFARILGIARRFKNRGRVVLIGGPVANMVAAEFRKVRAACYDVLVTGEFETVAQEVCADLRRGRWKPEYAGRPVGDGDWVAPRWDEYPSAGAYMGALQTGRGCPYRCAFCHEVTVAGRRGRHKPDDLLTRELDGLRAAGFRRCLIVDDNFTGFPRACARVLDALAAWNAAATRKMAFFVFGASMEACDRPALLARCAAAGVNVLLMGIETPNPASLREANKTQNLGRASMASRIDRLYDHGIVATGAGIVGFDHDGPDAFERQFELITATSIPIYSVTPLNAIPGTPLYRRVAAEGRLVADRLRDVGYYPWYGNVVPRRTGPEEMERGMKWLLNRLYAPARFGERVARLFERLADPVHDFGVDDGSAADRTALRYWEAFAREGAAERRLWDDLRRRMRVHPRKAPGIFTLALFYPQIVLMLKRGGFWDPRLARRSSPFAAA